MSVYALMSVSVFALASASTSVCASASASVYVWGSCLHLCAGQDRSCALLSRLC